MTIRTLVVLPESGHVPLGQWARRTVMVVVTTTLFVGCVPTPGGPAYCSPSGLRVRGGGTDLAWVRQPGRIVDPVSTRDDTLLLLARSTDVTKAPYVALGARVDAVVGAGATSVVVQEAPITPDGKVRWAGWLDVTASSNGGTVSFAVPNNPATMLSSDSADFEPQSSIRGAVLTVSCDAGTDQYGFAYRTDPPAAGIFGGVPA